MRPNLAQDAPPTALTVGGNSYNINYDFMTWIEVMDMMKSFRLDPSSGDELIRNINLIVELENKIFGSKIPEKATDVLPAIIEFMQGYPEAPIEPSGRAGKQTYSFNYDLNYIVLAIQNQFHVDLSYSRENPVHWWMFLLYFRSLCGDHYILKLMEIRGYDGKDKEMQRQARRFAIPRETSPEEQATNDWFNEAFYNS